MAPSRRILGVVTARGGSKGLPGKNLKLLAGKPLVAHAVEHALGCPRLARVIVSTDDEAIAAAGRAAGGETPFLRPAELARDESSSIDVLLHAVDALAAAGDRFDAVALLEPTSPLREASDIGAAIAALEARPGARALVSVTRSEAAHPEYSLTIDPATGRLRRMDGSVFRVSAGRRQQLSPAYHLAGVVYLSDVDALRSERAFLHQDTVAYEVPRWKAVEVDEPCDFVCAEALYEARRRGVLG